MSNGSRPQPVSVTCPTCGSVFHVQSTPVMPFCSTRCQQIDLGRWFGEEIGLPVEPDLEDLDEDGEFQMPQ
ncbi:MAG: DNA gyrase inhibitor YacG [Planctomycetaceae bacterium]|nr:DNA gyrase inhibitor YacG [Planctomycetaceae bacterium]